MRRLDPGRLYWPKAALLVRGVLLPVIITTFLGCAPVLEVLPVNSQESGLCDHATILVGHVTTLLTEPTMRPFIPQLRFFELINIAKGDRVRVNVESNETNFILPLPPGEYAISRVQISEGAFQALADLEARFSLSEGNVTNLGMWSLGIESPQYDRKILFSFSNKLDFDVQRTLHSYPCLRSRSVVSTSVDPAAIETRLYETAPYPRFWWFRRHHTS